MGIEYSLHFRSPSQEGVAALLSSMSGASIKPGASPVVEFRREAGNNEDMPDATVQVHVGWLYFCDHGGYGRDFLGHIVTRLVSEFGPVRIEDLE